MTDMHASDRDVSRAIRSWLHENRHEDASRIARVVMDRVKATPERRAGWPAWRTRTMNRFMTFGLGIAAVAVVGLILGSQLLGEPGRNTGGAPTATVSPSAAAPTSSLEVGLPKGPFALPAGQGEPSTTVTIPASSWVFEPEVDGLFKGDEAANLPEAGILFWSWKAGTEFYVYGDPCRWPSTKPRTPATTVDEIATALAGQASRGTSEPVDVTVGGYDGKAITLHVPEDASPDDCEGGDFATYGTQADDLARYQQGPGQIDDLWILDVDGSTVIIDAMYRPDSRLDLVDEMRTIAESATFELP